MRAQFVATPSPVARLAALAGTIIIKAARRLWIWQSRRATVAILQALDDRTLRDIGISRTEITSLVYGGAGGGRRRTYDEAWRWQAGQ